MGQVIHYQDDIFLIDSLIGFVADAANLEADADILGETVLSVIQQADRAFRTIRELVLANSHLVDRNEYLMLLGRAAATMADALPKLLAADSAFSGLLQSKADDLRAVSRAHRGFVQEIQALLDTTSPDTANLDDHVSGDELSELLRE
ncbi:MAG: hypothetical protein A2087_00895 [Spirochaetes bacterium GWD1_61_31]|nr:MAG: hypothetical protein A2Y37_03320 [Spirochaetes bacterium GWB1_60_80]OHD29639.1 MAG: hypothetical protein A2004_01860 [Spirochaetes bacterium GWC1_61_12]OHD37544.1 MAG: hypothetical protein A2087_00895 [Spirochaetes bacterium GWD1_61_31]OHD41946.1 MAG: hypothetical protein A2Y35_14370 [Spirochaetes bacterium GWE1_60_18]OHD61787.1 MAG: hypothetical protein A2Y32_13580 [Spirochaetes bacterium GWF1_60_12]